MRRAAATTRPDQLLGSNNVIGARTRPRAVSEAAL